MDCRKMSLPRAGESEAELSGKVLMGLALNDTAFRK
jgi:hypothetical protein